MAEEGLVPYAAAEIAGERILVLSAHPDDEVFGAGALLARLAEAAERICVAVFTSGEAQETTASGSADPAVREREAIDAGGVLGISDYRFLKMPDRGLGDRAAEVADQIRKLFAEIRPDLVVAPSPVEIHPDHRSLGRAVYEVVAASRPDDAGHDVVEKLRILFYEVSLPLLPNALAPLGAAAERKSTAMAIFASQGGVRDYAAAIAGLNRYRALTLDGADSAEAFRLISARDAAVTSLAELCRDIAPSAVFPGERDQAPVDVVVRTKNRPALLEQALESLARQESRPTGVVVVNDGGAPVDDVLARFSSTLEIRQVRLESSVGRTAAANRGFGLVNAPTAGFLDDDDVLLPDHFRRLLRARAAGPEPIAYSDAATCLMKRDGEGWREEHRELQFSVDFDPDYLLLANYIPLHTVLFDSALVRRAGAFDESMSYSEDWDLLIRLSFEAPFRHVRAVTALYRIFEEEAGHAQAGSAPFREARRTILERYASRRDPEQASRILDRLARRLWTMTERERAASGELLFHRVSHRKLSREISDTRDELARTNGERESLRAYTRQLEGTVSRRDEEIRATDAERESLRRQIVHEVANRSQLEATAPLLYAEIERLTKLVAEMESTKAWRLHRFVQSLKGR